MRTKRDPCLLLDDPDWDHHGEALLELRLTYTGTLLGCSRSNTRASHKHEIRREFHLQLKRLWRVHPALKQKPAMWASRGSCPVPDDSPDIGSSWTTSMGQLFRDYLAEQNERFGYRFVPLVTDALGLGCQLEILMLRPDGPGVQLVHSGDLDNRLKTVFDALRMPADKNELGGFDKPGVDEDPFYCLLADDKFIDRVAVTTDTLLRPILNESGNDNQNGVMLVIGVTLKPFLRLR